MASKYLSFSQGVEAAIREHKKHLGANEHPGGSNRTWFGKRYGWDGVFYCAIALWSTNDASGNSAASVKSASSSAIKRWGQSIGRNMSIPQRGDYIHVYKNGVSVHIERVLSYKNGRLIAIGSNTSNASGGSTANGGGTYINDRTAWWKNRNSNRGWSIKGITRPLYGLTRENLVALQKKLSLHADGVFGPATKSAVKAAQKRLGLKVDGFPGPATLGAVLDNVKVTKPVQSKPAPAKPSTPKAPAFPLPRKPGAMFYYGIGAAQTAVTGKVRNTGVPKDVTKDAYGKYRSIGLYAWQKRMKERGWKIAVDGKFGEETERVVKQFQKLIGVTVDGKIGPDTWAKAWTYPVK